MPRLRISENPLRAPRVMKNIVDEEKEIEILRLYHRRGVFFDRLDFRAQRINFPQHLSSAQVERKNAKTVGTRPIGLRLAEPYREPIAHAQAQLSIPPVKQNATAAGRRKNSYQRQMPGLGLGCRC